MAKIHDKYVIELAEVIKGYGNDPDVEDPFELSLFYRFYELPNIAIQRENFLKMKPLEPQRIKAKWDDAGACTHCGYLRQWEEDRFCANCGAWMLEEPYKGEEE